MAEFIVGQHNYTSKKMDVFTQANIARRLMAVVPALGPLGPLMQGFADASRTFQDASAESTESEAKTPDFDLSPLNPLFKAIGQLSDEDTQFLIKSCFMVTSRAGAGFIPLWNVQANRLQYDDVNFAETVQIVWNVLADNLGSFTTVRA